MIMLMTSRKRSPSTTCSRCPSSTKLGTYSASSRSTMQLNFYCRRTGDSVCQDCWHDLFSSIGNQESEIENVRGPSACQNPAPTLARLDAAFYCEAPRVCVAPWRAVPAFFCTFQSSVQASSPQMQAMTPAVSPPSLQSAPTMVTNYFGF